MFDFTEVVDIIWQLLLGAECWEAECCWNNRHIYITYIPLPWVMHSTHNMLCPLAFGAQGKSARSDGVRVSQHFLNVFIFPTFSFSTYTTEQLLASGTHVIYSSGPGVLQRHFKDYFCVAVTVWPVSDKDGDDNYSQCSVSGGGANIPIMYTLRTAFLHLFFQVKLGNIYIMQKTLHVFLQ